MYGEWIDSCALAGVRVEPYIFSSRRIAEGSEDRRGACQHGGRRRVKEGNRRRKQKVSRAGEHDTQEAAGRTQAE